MRHSLFESVRKLCYSGSVETKSRKTTDKIKELVKKNIAITSQQNHMYVKS